MHLFATDAYTVHRLVYETYAGEDGRRFLYAPFVLTAHLHAVLVRPFDVATRFAAGQAFEKLGISDLVY